MYHPKPSPSREDHIAELRYQRTQLEYARYEATSHMSDRIEARIEELHELLKPTD